jgi:hypothetical protein|tara:strand:- start:88 stop:951 length:864 start_codon:yes stop_codon:yes gene_type:complete
MNRILKRPMFRMGGSSGTGITSGLDRPQQMAKGGRIGYQQGSMPNFQLSGLPGFATQLGLNLLSTPPQGNIFQTAAVAAQDPFRRLQAGQAAEIKTASDRAFAEKLAKDERDFLRGETTRKLESAERIAGMNVADTTKRVQDIADTKYEGDIIKAQREVDFPTEVYPNLVSQYGNKQVATTVIDSTNLQKQKDIDKFVDLNPFLATKFVYDVATGKTMTFVKDKLSGRFKLIPADSADIDTIGDDMPDPDRTPGLFGQKTKPNVITPAIKEFISDKDRPDFGMDFYD